MPCNHLLKTASYLMDYGKKENQENLYYQKKNPVFVLVVDSSLKDYSLFVPAMQQPSICLGSFGNHVHRGGILTQEKNPEKWNRPVLERELDAGAFHQLGRGRGQIRITGGNPVMPQPSPIEPNQQDRGSNQRGYSPFCKSWRALADYSGCSRAAYHEPLNDVSQLLAGIITGETGKLV